ncbi:hypothetical protein D3C87_854460 [compost metagenome]
MDCKTHDQHSHVHSADCGHLGIRHQDHVDYLHDGHLHHAHEGHVDEHRLDVSAANPATCKPVDCGASHGMEIPHGDHVDHLVDGRLHHHHADHCDDHGPVTVVSH